MPFLTDMATGIPLDPADLDRIPPVDIDLCPTCWGEGGIDIVHQDATDTDECPACHGTGERGAA